MITREEAINELSVFAERMDSEVLFVEVSDISLDAVEAGIEALKERKTGKWHCYRCSECKQLCTNFLRGSYMIDIEKRPNYCPYCGAKMKGEWTE